MEGKKAGLYSRTGEFLKLLYVSPHVSLITEGGKSYMLRSEVFGTLRFHEVEPDTPDPTPPGELSADDRRFLRSLKIASWGDE